MPKVVLATFVGLLALMSQADSASTQGNAFLYESSIGWKTYAFPIHR
jgi:hypothetical protein